MTPQQEKPVVVGIDGSGSALEAARWAAVEAWRWEVPLRLVHSYEFPFGPSGLPVEESVFAAARSWGRHWLSLAHQEVREVVPSMEPELVLEAAPVVAVLERESRTASMVVLGTRSGAGLVLRWPSLTLAARAHCPVVVVRGRPENAPRTVVVGVDGSAAGEAALAFAFEEAQIRSARLVAVHAWAYSPTIFDDPLAIEASEALSGWLAGWQEKYPDVEVVCEVVQDRPTRALQRCALHAQLVVVGSRGRGDVRSLVLGSTSRHLLRRARCPVAVARVHPDGGLPV